MKAADWGDRAASVLLRFLIGYGEIDPQFTSGIGEVNLRFRLVKKDDKKKRVEGGVERGFQVFRTFDNVEVPVGELWIGDVAYFKIGKEELKRLVEEAKETAPDLLGMDTSRQCLEWRATDVTTIKKQIVAGTVHSWQLRWYFGLLGEPKSFSGSANVTKEGIKFLITAYWPREREDQILGESRWLESLLGRTANNWRELVDAINWSWVLKRVEKPIGALKPWIGPESANDVERKGLVRRMLGELELLANLAEARRGMDDGRWKEVRAVRLAEAVEALSGGRIKGDHAKGLAQAIIYNAEGHKKKAEGLIEDLAKVVDVSREEVQGVVECVLSGEDPYVYCIARDYARDVVVRKFVAPALELVMLDKALNDNNEFDRERARLLFGEMYATALAGDGSAGRRSVVLAVGGELGGGAALLRLATLHLLNQLLPDELKFGIRTYVERDKYYYIAAHGENATKLKRLLAVTAPLAGGGYLSDKFNEFVKEARVEVQLDNIRLTKRNVAADLTISEGGAAVKYNVYLQNSILLDFQSTDRSRAELAARFLRLAGVSAEVSKAGNRGVWRVEATTDMLAAGREELRNALAEIVRATTERGWVDEKKAEFWLKKLERGRTVREGLPKYRVRLDKGALEIRFASPNPDSITRETQRLKEMGLVEDWHFTVKMPEDGRCCYVSIRREGLAHAAWLSVHGEGSGRGWRRSS